MQATANSRDSIQCSRAYRLYLGVTAVALCAVIISSCSSDPPSAPIAQPRNPTVVASINPADSATGASLNSIVTATFSRDLNLPSINTSTFLVSGVSGSISVSGKTATFTPSAKLMENTTYTVTLTTGIMDSDGEPLASDFTSGFTTGVPQAANAGPDQDVTVGGTVMLSATSDLTGTVTFGWTQVSGLSVAALSGASPSFTAPDTVSTLEFDVVADNGNGPSDPDRVVVWVLEDKDNAVWVSTSGSDSNPGSRDLPLATIQFAIDTAYNAGNDADVYIAAGVYNQSILVRSRVSLYGGFHSISWLRDFNSHETFMVGSDLALKGIRATALTIDGLRIKSASAMANGQYGLSSIAIGFERGDSITISHCILTAQDGESGKHGILPMSPPPSVDGHKGENAGACDRAGGAGGQILTGVGSGGAGGSGGFFNGFGGVAGEGTFGGSPGAGGQGPGVSGVNGIAGLAGNNGAPATIGGGSVGSLNRFDDGGYIRSNGGKEGSNGTNGSGGGGGGGGAGLGLCGAGGGGGGAGGLGGRRGFRGDAGGGSFGILLYRVTNCRIIDCHIITGNGGAGGSGGPGAVRGLGGKGGQGGTVNVGGAGGNGGDGGDGGNGGIGSGGGGGPTIGIIESREVSFKSGLTYQLGTPGAGGSGPGNAGDGATGLKAEVKSLP